MSFILYKKIGNNEYVYGVISYCDRMKKLPAQKSKYLEQVVVRENKEFIRHGKVNMQHEKLALDFFDSYS